MFDIRKLKERNNQKADQIKLNEFGASVNASMLGILKRMDPYRNGTRLLNREALGEIDDAMLKARHVKAIFAEVATAWEEFFPEFSLTYSPIVNERFERIAAVYEELNAISDR